MLAPCPDLVLLRVPTHPVEGPKAFMEAVDSVSSQAWNELGDSFDNETTNLFSSFGKPGEAVKLKMQF